jgi:hypothetical protein
MMDEQNLIKILSLKSLIVGSLPLEYKKTLLSPNWHTHQFSNQSKLTQNKKEDMRLELERVLKPCFQKN